MLCLYELGHKKTRRKIKISFRKKFLETARVIIVRNQKGTMAERIQFSFGNIASSVILSTYSIGLIAPMTRPSHRANLIPSAGRIEGSPWQAVD